jgi:hypothetical protein
VSYPQELVQNSWQRMFSPKQTYFETAFTIQKQNKTNIFYKKYAINNLLTVHIWQLKK